MSSATPPSRTKTRSIFTTILVLMTLSMTVLFIAFAAFHMGAATRAQQRDHEQYITTTLHFIRAELEGMLEADDSEMEELEEIEDVVLRENTSRRFGRLIVDIVDESGNLLLSTSGAKDLQAMQPPFPAPAGTPGEAEIVYWESDRSDHYVLSSLTTSAPDGRVRNVRIALDWSTAEDRIESFRRQSIAAVFVCTLLAALAAAFVTRHALRPLAIIRDAAESIRGGSFDARLQPQLLPAELSDLAYSFERMQEHLRDSFERLTQFSAELAHELRTPVHNLMGEAEVALSKPRQADEYREVLTSNLEEAARLSRIIDRLLFLSRVSRGSLETELLDIAEEADSVIEYHRPQADEIDVVISREGDGKLEADRTLLRRVFSNLLSNALDASRHGGRIWFRISRSSQSLTVEIADEGVGIDENDLPRVFERFHRSQHSRAHRPEGNGLGLAIVKSIVELHSGTVSIASTPGSGTTVTLTFPTQG